MARIFISYSRADRQFVDVLVPLLRRMYGNDSTWFDDDIHGGAEWWLLLLNEIANCELFIFFASNDSLKSSWCQAELREALRLQKPILPVIVRPQTAYPGEIEDRLASVLRHTQYVDMSQGIKNTNELTWLYASINRVLDKNPAEKPSPLRTHPVSQPLVLDRLRKRSMSRIGVAGAIVGILIIGASILTMNEWLGSDNGGHSPTKSATVEAVAPDASNMLSVTGTKTDNEATPHLQTLSPVLDLWKTTDLQLENTQTSRISQTPATVAPIAMQSVFDQTATAVYTKTTDSSAAIGFDTLVSFDGRNDYIEIPFFDDLHTQQFTIEAWISPNQLRDYDGIVVYGINNTPYGLQLWNNGALRFKGHNTGAWFSNNNLRIHEWRHIAISYDGTLLKFYFDGQLDMSIEVDLAIPKFREPLIIGADFVHDDEYFDGAIGEVRLWNYPRSQYDIEANMYVHLSGRESGLIGYWPLEYLDNGIARDLVDNHHGEFNG